MPSQYIQSQHAVNLACFWNDDGQAKSIQGKAAHQVLGAPLSAVPVHSLPVPVIRDPACPCGPAPDLLNPLFGGAGIRTRLMDEPTILVFVSQSPIGWGGYSDL